jgi:hypothetical protein|tara:strand:+ start:583 stop:1551 length:969 start_codon:yes stop_codon:yes gene_type:complete
VIQVTHNLKGIACYFGLTILVCSSAWAQRQDDFRRSELGDFRTRNALRENQSPQNIGFTQSDLGLQRPVDVKDTGFGYHLGFDSKLYYTNNAASAPNGDGREPSGIWENSLRNGFILGAFDLGGASFSPILSLGYSKFSHFGDDDIDSFDFDTLSISPNAFFQFSNGWTFRGGLGVMLDFAPRDGMENTYQQVSPTLALGKGFSIGDAQTTWEWSLAYHLTDSDSNPIDDFMDRFETAFLWSFTIPINRLGISPYLRFAYVNYANQDRDDALGSLGLDFNYSFTNWLAMNVFFNFSFRGSNNNDYDFTRFDGGGGLGLSAKF